MTDHGPTTGAGAGGGGAGSAGGARASRAVLALGMSRDPRPVDRVIDRLRRADGPEWLHRVVASAGLLPAEGSASGVWSSAPTVEALRAIKTDAASRTRDTRSEDPAAVAVYLCAVATALAAHGVNLSSRDTRTLIEALVDLGEACPPGWRRVFRRAALACADLAGGEV